MEIYFYKGKGNWIDKIIKLLTFSDYSHVECKVGDWFYSSSKRDNGVRKKKFSVVRKNWDVITLNLSQEVIDKAVEFAESNLGKKYDYFGAINSVFWFPINGDKDSWFCSEFCTKMLQSAGVLLQYNPEKETPGSLRERLM